MIIPHNQPYVDGKEMQALKGVIRRRWLSEGNQVRQLERAICRRLGRRYALGVSSGTAALHLALLALKVGPGDEVVLPTYTCVALLQAVAYVDARPRLVDVEPDGVNLDPQAVRSSLSPKTKAVVIPHMFGIPARIDELSKLGIPMIEDCAQSVGGFYKDKPMGAFGELGVFSFYATKMVAAGQGGLLVTDSKTQLMRVVDLAHYDQRKVHRLRFNYAMTDITAALARVQLQKLRSSISRRRQIAARYLAIVRHRPDIRCVPQNIDERLNFYRFLLVFPNESERERVRRTLRQLGITAIIPIESYQLLHRYMRLNRKSFPESERLCRVTLSLPIYPGLTKSQIQRITMALTNVLS